MFLHERFTHKSSLIKRSLTMSRTDLFQSFSVHLPRTLCAYFVCVWSILYTVSLLIFHHKNFSSCAITPCHVRAANNFFSFERRCVRLSHHFVRSKQQWSRMEYCSICEPANLMLCHSWDFIGHLHILVGHCQMFHCYSQLCMCSLAKWLCRHEHFHAWWNGCHGLTNSITMAT